MKTKEKEKMREKRIIKHPRICWAAKQLGVSRVHLWYVLQGERRGRPGLVEDYQRLKAKGDKIGAQLAAKLNAKEGA